MLLFAHYDIISVRKERDLMKRNLYSIKTNLWECLLPIVISLSLFIKMAVNVVSGLIQTIKDDDDIPLSEDSVDSDDGIVSFFIIKCLSSM